MRRTSLSNLRRRGDPGGSEVGPRPPSEPSSASTDEQTEARKLIEELGPEAALPRLMALIEQDPGSAEPRLVAAELLARQGRQDEAEKLLMAGLDLTPDNRELASAYARAPQNRGDKPEAATRWLAYCARFPDDPRGFEMAGIQLIDLGQLEDAEKILTTGTWLPQPGSEVLRNHARVAQIRSDWPEALRRWDAFRKQFPQDPGGYSGAAFTRHQIALGEIRAADALLEDGLRLFPRNGDIIGTYARIAQTRRAWTDALDRWEICIQQLPDDPVGYSGLGDVLRLLGRFDAAESALAEGAAKSPAHPGILSTLARVAHDRHDWPAALDRWKAYLDLFPNDSIAQAQLQLVLTELDRFQEAAALPSGQVAPAVADGPPPPAHLMLRFESLGQNCEFGVVQRHYGAEPLGLLRFSSTPLHLLVAALNNDLAGIGEPENTKLGVQTGEYVTSDSRYHMLMHTFIRAGDDDPQKRHGSFCRRLQYLRDKLLGDLADARKIFVYSWEEAAEDSDIRDLHRALNRFGANRLLFVRAADREHAAGTLRKLDDGLLVGYVDRLEIENPSFSVWLELCTQADQQLAPAK